MNTLATKNSRASKTTKGHIKDQYYLNTTLTHIPQLCLPA